MNTNKAILWCDRLAFFAFCALIYFLPISIALVESFSGVTLVCFFIKRGIIFGKNVRAQPAVSLREIVKTFLKSFKPIDSDLNKPIALFIFICFLSVLNSHYLVLSLKGFFFKLLQWTFLYFVFVEVMTTRKQLRIFLVSFFISAMIVIIDGYFQSITGHDFIYQHELWDGRISSSFRHSNDFGGYLIIVSLALFGLSLFCRFGNPADKDTFKRMKFLESPIVWRILTVGWCIFSVIALGLTLSRGAWVGFFAGLVFFTVQKKKMFLVSATIIITFIVLFSPRILETRKTYFLEGSGSGRTVYWQESWNMIRDFPILGVGLNSYSQEAPRYKQSWGGYPHNCYLQMAVETGIVGLLSFIWLLFVLFRNSLRNLRLIQDDFLQSVLMGLAAGLFGFLAHSFVDTNFYSVQLGNLMWVIMGAVVATQKIALTSRPVQGRP